MTGFTPIGGDHAIEFVAIELSFVPPLEVGSLYAVDARYEEFKELLPSREEFNSHAIQQTPDGTVNIIEQVQDKAFLYSYVAPNSTRIRSMRLESATLRIERLDYSRWEQTKGWSFKILKTFFQQLMEGVKVGRIGLHYSDVFLNPKPEELDPRVLFAQDTDLIPHRVFSKGALWHAHSGYFDKIQYEKCERLLERFKVNSTGGEEARVSISTSHIAMSENGLEFSDLWEEQGLGKILDILHARNKSLLNGLLSEDAKGQINLNAGGGDE